MIRRRIQTFAAPLSAAVIIGCSGLLDVTDPTAVEESDIDDGSGAELLRRAALAEMHEAIGYAAQYTGLLSDELMAFPALVTLQGGFDWDAYSTDLRDVAELESIWVASGGNPYRQWQAARMAAHNAAQWYEMYAGQMQRARRGEMVALRSFATLSLAEHICPGFALHEVTNGRPRYGQPLTTEQAFEHALASLDTAVTLSADSARILNFAHVARGRSLLGLGRFAEAASAVAGVPTSFVREAEYGTTYPAKRNQFVQYFHTSLNMVSVADNDGGNGLDFVSAADPRVPAANLGTAHDGQTDIFSVNAATDAPIVVASGVEARLIEAEAALAAGNSDWLTILNDLRATQVTPALEPLADPGTHAARVDVLFRERAFWLFGTAHRLGDLRRLIAHYGRLAEDIFPVGSNVLGNDYHTVTNLPFMAVNEDVAGTGVTGCTDR